MGPINAFFAIHAGRQITHRPYTFIIVFHRWIVKENPLLERIRKILLFQQLNAVADPGEDRCKTLAGLMGGIRENDNGLLGVFRRIVSRKPAVQELVAVFVCPTGLGCAGLARSG